MLINEKTKLRTLISAKCYGANGKLKWNEDIENLVTDQGANYLLQSFFATPNYNPAWYVGLYTGVGTLSTSDTMASHPGWIEVTAYNQLVRPQLIMGTAINRSITNGSNTAFFSISSTTNLVGVFSTSSSNKGGADGILYGEAAFGGVQQVIPSDQLYLTVAFSC